MTEASAGGAESKSGEYIQIWAENFSQVMAQIAGSAVPCLMRSEAPAELLPEGPDDQGSDNQGSDNQGSNDLWALVSSSGALRGEMRLRLPPATVLRLAQIFMSEPEAPEAAVTADHRDAVIELLRQVSGTVATSAKARWGELQLRIEAAAAPSWPVAEVFWLQAGAEGTPAMVLEFGLSAALVAELRVEKAEAAKAAVDSSIPVPNPISDSIPNPASDSGPGTGALDRLMDVQLAVTMRFGARQLLLREVLELSPGAVVELDRRIQEPVDLLLDGRLLARGEVVVIDGNYGLRVTDVSPLGPALGRNNE
jgi:flagellar motor switch protein FliN